MFPAQTVLYFYLTKSLDMSKKEVFIREINEGYQSKGERLILGGAMLDGKCATGALVGVPLRMMNRHGLIAGATGTGKTKTLQVLAEQLSCKGVPSLLMDIKGDLSGIARPGKENERILQRQKEIGIQWEAAGVPVELLTISNEPGARMRATVSEFGPVLLSRILDLNDTQSGVVSLAFKYCDDNKIPLLDLKDLKKTFQYLTGKGKEEIRELYGTISEASVSTILRKIIEIEQQGAERFFGEESFDVQDLCRTSADGKGIVSIIRLTDIQDRPKLFSTFMLCLLAEVYSTFPETGDAEKPKLVIFIDEAHLIFEQASKALQNQIEAIVRLVRSKGVGVFFCTQTPSDVPEEVLGQLGLKIQHALRAFTPKDRKMIVKTAENFPLSSYYDVPEVLTSLGTGEALVTALNEKGRPTPLANVMLRAPQSRMEVLTPEEIGEIVGKSRLVPFYNREVDRESAYEMLGAKIDQAVAGNLKEADNRKRAEKAEPTVFEEISRNPMARQIGRAIATELTRGLLGVLGIKRTRSGGSYRRTGR